MKSSRSVIYQMMVSHVWVRVQQNYYIYTTLLQSARRWTTHGSGFVGRGKDNDKTNTTTVILGSNNNCFVTLGVGGE